MADGKTSPWLVGGLAFGALIVFYVLYVEYQASVANASQTAAQNSAVTQESGIVNSILPDQTVTEPSIASTQAVSPSEPVAPAVGTATPTVGTTAYVPSSPANVNSPIASPISVGTLYNTILPSV
jgi:hypothetical protein